MPGINIQASSSSKEVEARSGTSGKQTIDVGKEVSSHLGWNTGSAQKEMNGPGSISIAGGS